MTELASILNVPVLKPGTFHAAKGGEVKISPQDLDAIIRASNQLQPVFRDALNSGEFRGNPGLAQKLGKPVPAPVNFNHETIPDDILKEALSDVSVNFDKAIIDNEVWITEDFHNVPTELADMIRRFFTRRSVELLPITDPDTQEEFPMAIYSTAFLDNATPPAVPGQSSNLIVEFGASESPAIVITNDQPMQKENIMPDKNEEKVDVSELQKAKDTLTAKEAQIAELQAKAEAEKAEAVQLALKAEREKQGAIIAELQRKQDAVDAEKTLVNLSRVRMHDGKAYKTSKAAVDVVKKHIHGNGIVELAEGETQRGQLANMVDQLVELSLTGGLLVPLTTQGEQGFQPPDTAPKSDSAKVAELMAADPKLTKSAALVIVNNQKFGGE